MVGLKNVEHGVLEFLHHISDDAIKAAIQLLAPSIQAVAKEITKNSLHTIEQAASDAAKAALSSKADGGSNSDAGKAALSAAAAVATKEAKVIGDSALHAIATATVTAA